MARQRCGLYGQRKMRKKLPPRSDAREEDDDDAGSELQGRIEQAQSTRWFNVNVCERDRVGHRVLNTTALGVAFWSPPRSSLRLHVHRVSRAGRLADVSHEKAMAFPVTFRKLCSARRRRFCGFSGRFDDSGSFLAWSHCEDVARSGGNVGASPFFTFFVKVRESRRLLALRLVLSSVVAELGLHHRSIGYGGGSSQYPFMSIIDPSYTFHSASSSGHHVTEEHVIEEDEEDEIDSQDDIDDNENMEKGDDEPLFDIVRVNNTEIEYEQDHPDVFTSDHLIDEATMNNSHEGIDIPSVKTKLTITPEEIVRRILDEYHVEISYKKAWIAKCLAMKQIFGSWESSYATLPRSELDHQEDYQVRWEPYTDDILQMLPAVSKHASHLWLSRVPLLSFSIVEMHVPDRVLRQFGRVQRIPAPVDALDRVTRKGCGHIDWGRYFAHFVQIWHRRTDYIIPPDEETVDIGRVEYMAWYWSITRQYIDRPGFTYDMRYEPRDHIERSLVEGPSEPCADTPQQPDDAGPSHFSPDVMTVSQAPTSVKTQTEPGLSVFSHSTDRPRSVKTQSAAWEVLLFLTLGVGNGIADSKVGIPNADVGGNAGFRVDIANAGFKAGSKPTRSSGHQVAYVATW
ncbi:hypothetical protein Taro_021743 [Colocasia esculenta]|uniref:Aminotransferase-like plant mobile domain-containing protein n=1 Tax=Colocasia esculenta TaxID=4460 RepID=A0A843USB5_COLES|nr:hypothetical protein [Colocasia esculenta]